MFIPKIPENRLSDKIKQLTKLCEKDVKEYGEDSSWFKSSTSKGRIYEWEINNKFVLPDSYKCWLDFTSEARVRSNLAFFYDISDFVFDDETVGKDYIIIGELWGDGELLCISKLNHTLVVLDHGEEEVMDDFGEVLDELIRVLKGESGISKEMDDLLLSMLEDD